VLFKGLGDADATREGDGMREAMRDAVGRKIGVEGVQ
jgi:hypothetical protein